MSKLLSLTLTAVICCVMMTFAYANYGMMYPMPMKGGYYPVYGGAGGGIAPVGQGGIMQFFFMCM